MLAPPRGMSSQTIALNEPAELALPSHTPPETLLVALDVNTSPERRAAVEDAAREIAREHDARLIAFHVVQPPSPVPALGGLMMAPRATDDILRTQTKMAKHTLAEEMPNAEVYAPVGRPAKRIVRFAKCLRNPWIVIGSDDRGVLSRLIFGSVTDSVVRSAPCPVHVVPLPESS